MKTKRKSIGGIILAFFLTCLLAFSVIFGGMTKNDALALEGLTFEAGATKTDYVLGEEIEIPQGTFTYGGKAYPAESILYYPSGNAYNVTEAELDETGKYTIEYRTVIEDTLVKEKREFTVLKSLYSTSSPLSKMQYGSPEELGVPFADARSPKGLHVSLIPGDTFNYNGVVDLSKSSRDRKTFQFYLTPQRSGAADVYAVYVKFTDIYDPNNYAIVSMYSYNSKALSSNATRANYVTACVPSIGQSYTGHYTTLQPTGGGWRDYIFKSMRTSGFCSFMSFYGDNGNDEIYFVDANGNRLPDDAPKSQIADFVVEEKGYLGQHQMDFWWNYEEKSIHSHQPLEFVKEPQHFPPNYGQDWTDTLADFDSPTFYSTFWEGFTTGECYVSMWAEDYSNATCDFVVTTLDGFDLTQGEPPATFEDTAAPAINVNYGKYTQSTYPDAKVGCAYPVFKATAMDGNDGQTAVSARAYYGFGTAEQYEVTCTDTFVPDRAGEFTIVYTAKDRVGNVATEEVVVTVATDANALVLNIDTDNAVKTGIQSTFVKTPAPTYSGGVGELTYSVIATHKESGTAYVGENNAFRPMEAGTYEVVCRVQDYIGQIQEVSYEVEISAASGPIFETLPNLPKYFISGYSYRLPALTAKGANENVEAEIYVLDGGDRALVEEGLYYTTGDTRTVSVIYSAGSGDDATELVFDIPLVNVKTSNRFDLSKYFYGNGFTATAGTDSSAFAVDAGETSASMEFINPLLAEGYNAEFKISKGNFKELSMILTDSVNGKESVRLSWKNESGIMFMYVNGNRSTLSTALDFGGVNTTNFSWSNATHTFSDKTSQLSLVIDETMYGEKFGGFSSGKIYVTFEMTDVTGGAELTFNSINGQVIRKGLRNDNNAPLIDFMNGSYEPRAYVGARIDVKDCVVADVISPDVTVTIKVLDPDEQEVDVKNGQFIITKAGEYKVQYILNDGSSENIVQSIITGRYENQIDILINGQIPTECAVGETVTPPKAIYTSVSGSVTGKMLVIDPMGAIVDITASGSFTASSAGTYVIIYYGVDVSGNTRTITYLVVAK